MTTTPKVMPTTTTVRAGLGVIVGRGDGCLRRGGEDQRPDDLAADSDVQHDLQAPQVGEGEPRGCWPCSDRSPSKRRVGSVR